VVNLSAAAYCGGLIASYALMTDSPGTLIDPTLRIYPFWFALAILVFTLPGAAWVAAIFQWARTKYSLTASYLLAILCGSATGACFLGIVSLSVSSIGIGAFFGFVTAAV
jgi:hypothetical protein